MLTLIKSVVSFYLDRAWIK